MPHCDADALTLAALGEPALGADDVEHVTSCAVCREELRTLREVVSAARGDDTEPEPVAPPASVWEAVVAATGVTGAPAPAREEVAGTRPQPAPGHRGPRRADRSPWLVAAAAAVVAGGAGVALGTTLGSGSDGTGTVLASAELGPLEGGPPVQGSALVRDTDAERVVEVDLAGLGSAEGYYEVWLLDPDGGLVSLGPLPAREGVVSLPVPEAVDLSRYSVVDVSDEPVDGDPAHSTVSVARGDLTVPG